VTVEVRDAGPFEKLVTFNVTDAELETAKSKAARRLSREVKIRGFRPGKAPRQIVEATVGAGRLRSEAIDDLIPEKLTSVLVDRDIDPVITPSLEGLDETDDGLAVEVRVTLWPKLAKVPHLADRKITVGRPEVTAEELEAQLERMRNQFAQLETVERAAAEGDFVSIDLSASRDGVEVAEASAAQILYEVGSGGFIDGIDEVLPGASAGDTVTFDGELPDGFGDKSGLSVSFKLDVTEIRQKLLPDLTDEWVDEVTEFETVAELTANLSERMSDIKKRSLAVNFREMALDELVHEVEIELPEALVRAEMDELLHRFGHRLEERGISFEDYFQATGIDQETFVEDLRNQADHSLRTRILLEAVADEQGLVVDPDEYGSIVEGIALRSEQPDAVRAALQGGAQGKSLVGDILRNKALEAIIAGATPVDDDGNEVDLSVPEVEAQEVEAQVVEGEVVEAEVVEAEVVGGAEEE